MIEPVPTIPSESAARAELAALPGLTWQSPTRDELPELAALYAASDAYDRNPERMSLERLEDYWDSPRSVPDADLIVGRDGDGVVAAVGWSGCNRDVTQVRRVFLGGTVHPVRRGEGIGRVLLAWELAHALDWDSETREAAYGPLAVRLHAPVDQSDVRDLAERFGMPAQRYFFEMSRPLGGDVGGPEPIDGIRLIDWDPLRSKEVHAAMDHAFRDHWGHADRSDQMWADQLAARSFRPAWSVLAVDDTTGAVVGAALNTAYEQDWEPQGYSEGYTDELGVLSSHRGRGVATALLRESMRRFAAAGMAAAGLGVDTDNASGALRLYEGLGYTTTAGTCTHELSDDLLTRAG